MSGKGNRITRGIPVPVPLCQPQIPHDFSRDRNQAAAVGSAKITAQATREYWNSKDTQERTLIKLMKESSSRSEAILYNKLNS
jgi:hypothetical protein